MLTLVAEVDDYEKYRYKRYNYFNNKILQKAVNLTRDFCIN